MDKFVVRHQLAPHERTRAAWTGLPLVLGIAGMVVGNRGRTARSGSGKCIAALVIGAVAVLGYLTIYVWDGFVAGNAGFLFD